MKINGKNALAGLLLVALINSASTAITDYCCDFSPTTCDWDTTSFLTAPTDGNPNTATYYPNFFPTLPDSYYTYLQDASGTTTSVNEFFVSNTNTTFRWDYYYDSPSPALDSYLYVYARNGPLIRTLIGNITTPQDYWMSMFAACDSTNNFCCGSETNIPCSVTLEIEASLGSAGTTGLFAIGDIGTCSDGPATTTPAITTPRPTLPPPHPPTTECCDFNTDVCGISSSNWYWSAYILPSQPVPPIDVNITTYYLWTDIDGATLYSFPMNNVQDDTKFSVDFYATDSYVTISFYFLPASAGRNNSLGTLYGEGDWFSITQLCDGCCYPYIAPCDGQMIVQVNSFSSPFVAAIDNAGVNSACQDALPCCFFDNSDMCSFANPGDGSYFWQWSGSSTPSNYVPPNYPTSTYEYLEITTPNPTALNVALRSPLISIVSTQQFLVYLYAKTPLGAAGPDQLLINFREESTGLVTELDFVKDTTVWEYLTLQCSEDTEPCCQGLPTCSGYIEFTAYIEALSTPLIFGIDAFQVGESCTWFPGASDSALLHFGHPSSK